MVDPNAYQQMQDEMSRFEAEISGGSLVRPVIAAGTFGVVQQQLERGSLPPPPPPPAFLSSFDPMAPRMMYPMGPAHMMVPHQVQRLRPPGMPHNMQPNMPQNGPEFPHFMRPNMPGPQMLPPQPKPQPVVLAAAPKLYKQTKQQDDKEKAESIKPIEEPPAVVVPEPMPAPPKAPVVPQTSETQHKPRKEKKSRKVVRTAGGQVWEDVTLLDWPDDDFRMFCGDLGNDVSDELLIRTFSKYTSFQRAKVIRDKRTNKSKGFGFVSFKEPTDFIKAMKEMDGRYVGSRPIKLRKSTWRNRALDVVRKKEKEKAALLSLMMSGGKS